MLDKNGHEILDQTPLSLPVGFKRPETLAEQVQRLVRTSVSREAAAAGAETFEEAEDFDVDDEVDPTSPYEEHFDPTLGKSISAQEFKDNEQIYRARYLKAQQDYHEHLDQTARMEASSLPATPVPAPTPKPTPDPIAEPPVDPGK